MNIDLKILNKELYANSPEYATAGSAAIDLVCPEDIVIPPGETRLIHTGIAIHIGGDNVAAIILPRSGLGTRGLVLANTVGLIDSDYQGELVVAAFNRLVSLTAYTTKTYLSHFTDLFNHRNDHKIELKSGDRFCQLMFVPVIKPTFNVVEEFSAKTERNVGGFGSSGR